MRILIVEDKEDSRIMLNALLEGVGHDVVCSINGKNALDIIKDSIPDLIITDILMPEMDGYDFCRAVKNDPDLMHIPLIFYTATYISKEDQELGLLMGASRFIIKPMEPRALVDLINEVSQEEHPTRPNINIPLKSLDKMHLESIAKKLQQKVSDLESINESKKEQDAKLIHLASEFHNIDEALSDFTDAASHELLEPIRKISSFSSRLNELYGDHLDERQQVYLNAIERSSIKMKNYIEDMGTFIGASNTDLVFEDVSLEEVFSTIFERFAIEIRKEKAKITMRDLHNIVSDKLLLVELFEKIISNSLIFKKQNEPPTINIKSQATKDGSIEVSIEDSGVGFDEKYADRIFKPFKRLRTQSQDERSGMGLAICKKIVTRLNGQISVSSFPERGSTFTIKLPSKPQKAK